MIVGILCDSQKKSFQDCISCSLSTNNCEFSSQIIHAIIANLTKPRPFPSVTDLIGCPRRVILTRKNDIYVPLENLYYSYRGTAFHKSLEIHKVPDSITETRFFTEIDGVQISGQIDFYDIKNKILLDNKTTVSVPLFNRPYGEHAIQTNIYRYLLHKNGYEVDKIIIQYLDMKNVKKVPVKLMSFQEVEDFLRKAILLLNLDSNKIPQASFSWLCGYCFVTDLCVALEKKRLISNIYKKVLSDLQVELPESSKKNLLKNISTLVCLADEKLKQIYKLQQVNDNTSV